MKLVPTGPTRFSVESDDGRRLGSVYLHDNGYWQARTLNGNFLQGGENYVLYMGFPNEDQAGRAVAKATGEPKAGS